MPSCPSGAGPVPKRCWPPWRSSGSRPADPPASGGGPLPPVAHCGRVGPPSDSLFSKAVAPVLLGLVAGAACQLQQPQLFTLAAYVAGAIASGLLLVLAAHWRSHSRWRRVGLLLAAVGLSAAVTGWRAAAYASDGLDPALEDRDLVVTFLFAAMPQRSDL